MIGAVSNMVGAVGSSGFDSQLKKLVASPAIVLTAISAFKAEQNVVTSGVDVTFTLTNATGIASITLKRNQAMDPASATVLQSWNASLGPYTWSDTDKALQAYGQAYYWLELNPVGTSGTMQTIGPQSVLLNPQLVAPVQPTEISAGHGAAVNGAVLVTANVAGVTSGVKIYVSGYNGVAGNVAIASASSSPVQFSLEATGETVTLEAVGVSLGGAETLGGPNTTLVLTAAATIPAKPQGVAVIQLASGNQVSFPASKDAGSTYQLYRSQRNLGFVSASLLATITGTAGTINYLDTGGLSGDWQYFVIATNTVGNSLPSDPAYPPILFTSATIPANVGSNTTNTATVDSIDSGTSALVRVYGPGGVGTSYSRLTGFGSLTRSPGTVSGLAYTTAYVVIWTGSSFIATTSYLNTLPDGYEIVGSLTTTAATGVSGSGATATAVIDSGGHVTQVNPVADGSGYGSAIVSFTGGGGSIWFVVLIALEFIS